MQAVAKHIELWLIDKLIPWARNPRTECGCHPVAFISSLAVTPPARFSRSRMVLVLLPSRPPAALGAFLAGVAFLTELPFFLPTWAPCGATRAFLPRDRNAN
jgi:hypothetical protein